MEALLVRDFFMRLQFIIDKEYDLEFAQDEQVALELHEAYARDNDVLSYTVAEYQKSWDQINDAFSSYIERATEEPWAHANYTCVVSPVHAGISNWDGSDRIIRWWKEHPLLMRRITAHELILHHFFVIVHNHFLHEGLTDNQIWALAEIAAFALTSLMPEVKKFWLWDISGYYMNHNYPQIVPLQNLLKEPFLKRKNFSEYVRTGIAFVRQYPNISPSVE